MVQKSCLAVAFDSYWRVATYNGNLHRTLCPKAAAMGTLPYITTPGNIVKALNGIKSAAVPDRVSQDFVKTILKIPSGSGDQMTSFLKSSAWLIAMERQMNSTENFAIRHPREAP